MVGTRMQAQIRLMIRMIVITGPSREMTEVVMDLTEAQADNRLAVDKDQES